MLSLWLDAPAIPPHGAESKEDSWGGGGLLTSSLFWKAKETKFWGQEGMQQQQRLQRW